MAQMAEANEPAWSSHYPGERRTEDSARELRLDSYLTRACAVVFVGGELDASSASRLHDYVRRIIDRPSSVVVIDLSELASCDASGLAALFEIGDHAKDAACEVVLAEPPPLITRTLHAEGRHFTIAPKPGTPCSPRPRTQAAQLSVPAPRSVPEHGTVDPDQDGALSGA